jgi:hypothetical protein
MQKNHIENAQIAPIEWRLSALESLHAVCQRAAPLILASNLTGRPATTQELRSAEDKRFDQLRLL